MRKIDLHCYPNTEPWIKCQGPYVEALAKYWNRAWTWADRKHYEKGLFAQFGQYVLACWLAIVLQMLLTNLLAHHMEILVANLISIVLTSVLNFLINDIWTFGRRGCMNCINER